MARTLDKYATLVLAALAMLVVTLFPEQVRDAWTVFAALVPLVVLWQIWRLSRLERRIIELQEALRRLQGDG